MLRRIAPVMSRRPIHPAFAFLRLLRCTLWVLIALLPLRGWAVAGMGIESLKTVAAHTLMNTMTAADDEALPPCHQHHNDNTQAETQTHCAHCTLCHAASAPPLPITSTAEEPRSSHVMSAHVPTGHAQQGWSALERPPRA
ncbi:hypothetical protein LepocDRAFT_00002810 [Leptothrix ochracea L12]|uniref:DUF2946 domain-containing protein n=1 Tax=Leptothrix ochracea L12 TaxID=735332 RepID=I4Z5Q7_9BURK|nr:hypothetical protein [Leptothrix ochracea]EIM31549.1 hypothetical protein LepocDRAFT_00002810 [Leptothrix ochracea L12]